MARMSDLEVVHQPDQDRFMTVVDGWTAVLTYDLTPGGVAMTHTIVPSEIGGRGVAGELTRAAVAWARGEQREIDPRCSYVRSWLARHS